MTIQTKLVLAAAIVFLAIFGAGPVYMICFSAPGMYVPAEAVYVWLASGYAGLGLSIWFTRLDGPRFLNRALSRG